MDSENRKKTNQPLWLYALLGLLAIALVFFIVRNSSLRTDKEALEAEKEMQRLDFQAEVDSLMKVHNDLKESYGELSLELAEKESKPMPSRSRNSWIRNGTTTASRRK